MSTWERVSSRIKKPDWKDVSGIRCELYGEEWPERYNDWADNKDGPFLVPSYTSGSDYSGSLVNVSNYQVFKETFSTDEDGWWANIHGGYGTFAIIVNTAKAPKEALDFFAALEEYPLADEDHWSYLEFEVQQDAWNDWVRNDFVIALRKRFDKEFVNDEKLAINLFKELRDRSNTDWANEQGSDVWIDLDRIIKAATKEDVADWPEES